MNMGMMILMLICFILHAHAYEAFPTTRDKYTWPFANYSIWNLPIGEDAVYVPAQLGTAQNQGVFVDLDVILLNPSNPSTDIYFSSGMWTGSSRCMPDGGDQVQLTAPMPSDFFVPSDGNNYATAILLSDNNTIAQTQPICRCNASTPWTTGNDITVPLQYLDGEGILGAHGGSGLSSIGGTIRLGEIQPGVVIRHALKMNLDANLHYYRNPCFRWPAIDCDGYHMTVYNGDVPQLTPGSLLAIPYSVDIASLDLKTAPGASIAWTLQNYGAYLVDDTWYYDIFAMEAELSPQGNFKDEFLQAYGYEVSTNDNGWARDIAKIYALLNVVDSWSESVYEQVKASSGKLGAGGGAARQPWAPPFAA